MFNKIMSANHVKNRSLGIHKIIHKNILGIKKDILLWIQPEHTQKISIKQKQRQKISDIFFSFYCCLRYFIEKIKINGHEIIWSPSDNLCHGYFWPNILHKKESILTDTKNNEWLQH